MRGAGYVLYNVCTVTLENTLWYALDDVDLVPVAGHPAGRKTDLLDKAVLEPYKDCPVLTSIGKKRDASDVWLDCTAAKIEGI